MAKKGLDFKYADVGNKVDYAAVVPDGDGWKFIGWIRKSCCADKSEVIKGLKKEDIGL